MLDDALLTRVLREALKSGGDLAEIFVERRRSSSFRLDDSKVEDVSAGIDSGAGIRVLSGDRSAYAFTNLLTSTGLIDAAKAARAGISGTGRTAVADLTGVAPPVAHHARIAPGAVGAGAKVDALKAADDAARSAGADVRQVVASYGDVEQEVLIASSDGRRAEDSRVRTRMVVQVVAARDGQIATGFDAPGHSGGYELLEAYPPERIASRAAIKALAMLAAEPSPAGEFPVVLAAGTGGVLIHEACGHGLEADTLVKEASVYANRNGDRFGSDIVTIVDDGTVPNAWGSVGFDDEGTPAQNTVLFEKGVLVGHISDLQSARKIGHPPTGNGRGGEVNPATGNFVFGMNEAYMIENGAITHPIKGAQLIGNGPKMLGVIDAVADDFLKWEGVCGKDGQHAPVTTGMPTVLLGKVTVGGTEA
jgi:TldD protein